MPETEKLDLASAKARRHAWQIAQRRLQRGNKPYRQIRAGAYGLSLAKREEFLANLDEHIARETERMGSREAALRAIRKGLRRLIWQEWLDRLMRVAEIWAKFRGAK